MDLSNKLPSQPGFSHGLFIILILLVISFFVNGISLLFVRLVPQFQSWSMLFSFVVTLSLALYAAMIVWRNTEIEFRKVSPIVYVLLLPATIGMSIVTESIVTLIPMPQVVAELFAKMIQFDLPGFLTVCVGAAILEELIFRGVILKGFLKKYKPAKAIIYSALLFGIVHLNPWQFIGGFIAGLVIGWVYYKTKSIWPGIFIHFINNSFSFYIGYKYHDINTTFYEIAGGFLNYLMLLLGSLTICYLVYLKLKSMRFTIQQSETTNNI